MDDSPSIPNRYSISKLAEMLGCDRGVLSGKLSVSGLTAVEGAKGAKTYLLSEVINTLYEFKSSQASQPTSSIDEAKLRLANAKASEAEIKLGALQKTLVPMTDVLDGLTDEYNLLRANLLNIPRSCAHDLVPLTNTHDITERLTEAVNEALESLTLDSASKLSDLLETNEQNPTIQAPEHSNSSSETQE